MYFWLLIYYVHSNPDLFQSAYFKSLFDLEFFIKENEINIVPVFTEQICFRVELDANCGHVKKYYQFDDGDK